MATAFKVEAGVPVPRDRRGGPKYPFRDMAVGESFEAPYSASLIRSAHAFGARNSMMFTTRRVGEGTVRVWRVA